MRPSESQFEGDDFSHAPVLRDWPALTGTASCGAGRRKPAESHRAAMLNVRIRLLQAVNMGKNSFESWMTCVMGNGGNYRSRFLDLKVPNLMRMKIFFSNAETA